MTEKLKLKTETGKIINYPVTKVRSIISTIGYTGRTLMSATAGTFDEAKKLANKGIITTMDLEKAIVNGINNTNNIAIGTVQKITRKFLG